MEQIKRTRGMQFYRAAMRYYPDLGYSAAIRRFRQEIRCTRGMMDELKQLGYNDHVRYLTPRQMKIIEDFLGEP